MRKRETPACPVCSKQIVGGVAYFSFGVCVEFNVLDEKGMDSRILEGFCRIGYHGSSPDVTDSVEHCIGPGIEGGQLDISFCSLACVRKWFCNIVDGLEPKLQERTSK